MSQDVNFTPVFRRQVGAASETPEAAPRRQVGAASESAAAAAVVIARSEAAPIAKTEAKPKPKRRKGKQ
jgi:hypothetical protein